MAVENGDECGMKKLLIVIPAMFLTLFQAYPPVGSTFTLRVTNRRSVSHILHELRGAKHYLTLITTHPRHWAFHARSHALYYPCGEPKLCLAEMKKLDRFLKSGYNFSLKLQGSIIKKITYHPPPSSNVNGTTP